MFERASAGAVFALWVRKHDMVVVNSNNKTVHVMTVSGVCVRKYPFQARAETK